MSGGSYDYLYCKEVANLFENDEILQAMADRLLDIGAGSLAARDTGSLLVELEHIRLRFELIMERLSPVWKAVEWYDSKDFGESDVRAAIEKYNSGV